MKLLKWIPSPPYTYINLNLSKCCCEAVVLPSPICDLVLVIYLASIHNLNLALRNVMKGMGSHQRNHDLLHLSVLELQIEKKKLQGRQKIKTHLPHQKSQSQLSTITVYLLLNKK